MAKADSRPDNCVEAPCAPPCATSSPKEQPPRPLARNCWRKSGPHVKDSRQSSPFWIALASIRELLLSPASVAFVGFFKSHPPHLPAAQKCLAPKIVSLSAVAHAPCYFRTRIRF